MTACCLGLKGTFSEVQWHQMRGAVVRRPDEQSPARRTAYAPAGRSGAYQADGILIKTPDQQVQDSLQLVFDPVRTAGQRGQR